VLQWTVVEFLSTMNWLCCRLLENILGTSCGFGVHRMLRHSWVAERLRASQGGLNSMKLVIFIIQFLNIHLMLLKRLANFWTRLETYGPMLFLKNSYESETIFWKPTKTLTSKQPTSSELLWWKQSRDPLERDTFLFFTDIPLIIH
jgi:hypothetical protein